MKLRILFSCVSACLVAGALSAAQQTAGAASEDAGANADSYYHFALGHLYEELAITYGDRGEYLDRAIDNYRLALEADPDADLIADELSSLYIQAGRLREAVEESEAILKRDPDNVNARRILGRIYLRLLSDPQQRRVNEEMLGRAIEQYTRLSELRPGEVDNWVTLGRLHKLAQDSLASEEAYNRALQLEPSSEEALVGLAMVYSDLGDTTRAAEMLRKVVEQNPEVPTLAELARNYEQQEEFNLAAETYRQALSLSPTNSSLKRAMARNLALADRDDEAIEVYSELVAEDPTDAESQFRLSQIYTSQKDYEKAWESLQAAKQGAPDSLELLYLEVNLLEARGDAEGAIERLQEILQDGEKESYSTGERTNRVVFLDRLAQLYRADRQYDESADVLRQIGELDNDLQPRVAAQIGDTYRQARQFEKAAEILEAAAKEFPDDRTIAIIHATVLADLGKNREAVAAIEKLTQGDRDLDDLLTLAQIYEKTKRYGDMERVTNRALNLAESDSERAAVLFMRGAMFERQKKYDDAESAFREVLQLDPSDSSAMNYLGYMLADRNVKLEEAHDLISQALDHEPESGAYLDSLGWVFYRMDRLEEAEEYLMRAVEKVPDDPVVHEHLGDVYSSQGKLKEAVAQWRISLQESETISAAEKDTDQMAAVEKKVEGAEIRLARESGDAEADQQ